MQLAYAQDAPVAARAPTDPVCGMNVDPATAFGSHDHLEQMYWFCSSPYFGKIPFRAIPDVTAEPVKECPPP